MKLTNETKIFGICVSQFDLKNRIEFSFQNINKPFATFIDELLISSKNKLDYRYLLSLEFLLYQTKKIKFGNIELPVNIYTYTNIDSLEEVLNPEFNNKVSFTIFEIPGVDKLNFSEYIESDLIKEMNF